MRPPRFTIAGLLMFIGVCGIGFAALRSPSYLWANTVSTLALGALIVAGINVAYRRDRQRAFWGGFLIAGGAYFTIYAVPFLRESLGPRLATEAVLDFLYAQVAPPLPVQPLGMMGGMIGGGGSGVMVASPGGTMGIGGGISPAPVSRWVAWTTPDYSYGVGYPIGGTLILVSSEPFRQIGHSLLTLLIAALAGIYARHVFDTRTVRREEFRPDA
jgi:hypothetical protein